MVTQLDINLVYETVVYIVPITLFLFDTEVQQHSENIVEQEPNARKHHIQETTTRNVWEDQLVVDCI